MQMEQMYDGGFTSRIYCKIIKPIKMEGVKTSNRSRELIGSTERIISPLEAKAIHSSIDSTETVIGSTETVLEYEAKHKLGGAIFPSYGNHDSAPRMYGATFSPIAIGGHVYTAGEDETVLRCDPDSKLDERPTKPWWQFWNASEMYAGKGLSGNISQGEKHIITSESKGLLRNSEKWV